MELEKTLVALGPTLVAIAVGFAVPAVLYSLVTKAKAHSFELHAYQYDFLKAMAALPAVGRVRKAHGLTGPAAALQAIVEEALADKSVGAEIYDGFQCVHCGSKNPEPWIKERKGKKTPYPLEVTESVAAYLASELLVPVEKVGQPPVRQVVDGPRKAEPSKAARCAVDWAIQKYGALADGKPKATVAKKAPRAAKSPSRRR